MSSKAGFTFIELLVVITILGILSSLALPRYSAMKERAYVTTMKSDLRNLRNEQEGFLISFGDYAGSFTSGSEVAGSGNGSGTLSYEPSDGVEIQMAYIANSEVMGWFATARHVSVTSATSDECGIYVGPVSLSPSKSVTMEGVATCY